MAHYNICESEEMVSCISERRMPMMPLVFAKAGDTVTITRISGKDEIRQHLADLGFVVEAKVLIISQMGGNLIVQVKGSRVALDRSMAQRIFF